MRPREPWWFKPPRISREEDRETRKLLAETFGEEVAKKAKIVAPHYEDLRDKQKKKRR